MSDAQALCLECGLCCTGVWFSHVNLEPGEAEDARRAGLEVEVVDGQPRSLQCCALHREGSCSAYGQWRPAACAAYRCKLLGDFEEGRWSLDEAVAHVHAVKAMVERIGMETGDRPRGLLGKRFLMRLAGDPVEAGPARTFSAAAQLDAVALNRYYEKYFQASTGAEGPPHNQSGVN